MCVLRDRRSVVPIASMRGALTLIVCTRCYAAAGLWYTIASSDCFELAGILNAVKEVLSPCRSDTKHPDSLMQVPCQQGTFISGDAADRRL